MILIGSRIVDLVGCCDRNVLIGCFDRKVPTGCFCRNALTHCCCLWHGSDLTGLVGVEEVEAAPLKIIKIIDDFLVKHNLVYFFCQSRYLV